MSEINLQLAREYFELYRFRVLTHWRHGQDRTRGVEASSLLFVEAPGDGVEAPPPFLLTEQGPRGIHRAVVEVRAWHADRFYPSVIETNPILGHVASAEVADLAREVFGGQDFAPVLVISELAASAGPRARALELFRQLGIGHVLEFSTLLTSLAERLSADGDYAPSQTLQTLRLLKRYDLLRRQQLEFLFPLDPVPRNPAPVETELDPQA